MPLPKLIAPLKAIQAILAAHDEIITPYVARHHTLQDYSPTKLANKLLRLEETKLKTELASESLVHAGQILKKLNNDLHVIRLVQEELNASVSREAWNQYMYYFLKQDFLQKIAFLLNHTDCFDEADKATSPDLGSGMDLLTQSLKESEKMLKMLLDADNPEAKVKEQKFSAALRTQLNEMEEGGEFVQHHLEPVFKEVALHINPDYDRMGDLEGPMTHANPEQVQAIKQVLHYTSYPVELMDFITQHDDTFRVSDIFKALRMEMLAAHADALRNLGFQLYEENREEALSHLSRASKVYGMLLSLDSKDSAASHNEEVCREFTEKKTLKKKGTKRPTEEIAEVFVSPAQKRHHGLFDKSIASSSASREFTNT